MIENTLSFTNQSVTEEVEPSNANLKKPSLEGLNLSDIPHFTPSTREQTKDLPSTAPLSYDDGKMEYEFTCIFTDSRPMFIGLWDTDDLSACQRVSACKMDREEIVYDQTTGVGFFKTVDGLRWCFKKSPMQRSCGPFNLLDARGNEEPKRQGQSADDILATI